MEGREGWTTLKGGRSSIKYTLTGILSVLEGKVNLTELDKNKFKKYKFILRDLVKKGPLKEKKNILIQKGGSILPFFLTLCFVDFNTSSGRLYF